MSARVLLTGATGFIGAATMKALQRRGAEVVTLGRRPVPGAAFLEADLLRSDDLATRLAEVGAKRLAHLAWYAEHGKFWDSPLNFEWVAATLRLTRAFLAAGGRRVVGAGTCAEYDWRFGRCVEDVTPLQPRALYGVAKDATRRLLEAACAAESASFAWARIFFPYGPGEHPKRLVPSLFDVFEGRREPFAIGAAALRDLVSVEDAGEAIATLVLSEADGAFNIASGAPVTIEAVARAVAAACGADPQPVLDIAAPPPEDQAAVLASAAKISALGWRAQDSLARGLERIAAARHPGASDDT